MKILLVDDEAGALRDLLRVMEKAAPGDEIVTARESKAALSLCGEQRFDAVFLDIKMPDMDGLTLTSEIKRICPMTNIIIVTAYPNFALDALRLYVSDYILKPARPEDVRQALLNLRHPVSDTRKGLYVQCFGHFEVFYDGQPVRFRRTKVKELFAYLIDRSISPSSSMNCKTGWRNVSSPTSLYTDGIPMPSRRKRSPATIIAPSPMTPARCPCTRGSICASMSGPRTGT